MGRITPGSERSTRSRAMAASSAPDSMATRRDSICDSTWARSSFSEAPTARFSSGVPGFSQLSVICVSTPDLRPSQASRKFFQLDSSWTLAESASKRVRISAKSGVTWVGCVTPRSAKVHDVLVAVGVMELIGVAEMGRSSAAPLLGKSVHDRQEPPRLALQAAPLQRARHQRCWLRLAFCFCWRRGGGSGFFGQLRKAGSVFYGDVGQDFAV